MNLHGQEVLYDLYCTTTAVLKVDSGNKPSKNDHPEVNVKDCKCTDAESQRCNILSNSDDDVCFEMQKIYE